MTASIHTGARLAGIASAVPAQVYDNVADTTQFDPTEVKKVVALAGVKSRRVSDGSLCSSDLCLASSRDLLAGIGWEKDSIDVLIFVTQTPDYFLPSTSCLIHRSLELPDSCAVFDVGLGCSGYPYGLWLANMMIQTGAARRVLVLHGETPSLFTHESDRSTYLLFGDAGSATAVEATDRDNAWGFCLHSDGAGYADLIIPGGGFRNPNPESERDRFLHMNGANLFNFTVTRVPELIDETLSLVGKDIEQTALFFFHQSNQFIMKHIASKYGLPADRVPVILGEFGNTGGASVPLVMTRHLADKPLTAPANAMLLGYGVGLSWGSAYLELDPTLFISHREVPAAQAD